MLELKEIYFTVPDKEAENGPAEKTILNNISFTFEKGKFYGITGPNGCGKTSLAKTIMGINKATHGKIIYNGKEITEMSITDRAREGIAYGFQHSARFKGVTFRDLLAIAAGTDDEGKLMDILARVGFCSLDFLDKPVDSTLSGGEIKKIELATTIARHPGLAIYDEPDTGIDLWTIEPMVKLIKRQITDYETTTIVVSHNKAFLEAADCLVLIKEGQIAYTGDLEGAKPLLSDLSVCRYTDLCEGEIDAQCYR
ncbi:ATP-binding cassette domain-containing protein [Desulfobacter latus]|uniref:ATP-binding cassette domain-containing protein n=1 Tax=Desulfobacter latus TaxID=2292 RepID=A0A850T8B5_9BACT|nr:ATP-binding cassette domain-containing protein [Desulfobacter latus]NWH03606.1 ATP-binding cassette domain-containing protein [Desulfobacter latus]